MILRTIFLLIKLSLIVLFFSFLFSTIKTNFDYTIMKIEMLDYKYMKEIIMYVVKNNSFFVQYILIIVSIIDIYKMITNRKINTVLDKKIFQKCQKLTRNFDFYNTNETNVTNYVTLQKDNIKNKIYDEFLGEESGILVFGNSTGKIDYDKYLNNKENIKQYLNINTEQDIKITRFEDNKVLIDIIDRFPKNYNFSNERHLREQEIFFGTNENNEDIFININKLTHYFVNGASGSGKTIFIYQILMSVFYNLKYFHKVYLVDLKGGISFLKFLNIMSDKIVVVKDLNELYDVVNEINELNDERMREIVKRQESGEDIDKIDDNPVLFLIDEFAQIQDREPDKDDKEMYKKHKRMLKQFDSLAATSRSQNIKMFIITQKGTIKESGVTFKGNLQSQILLKVKQSEAIIGCLGSSEALEELGVNPKKFGYGRMIFQDDSEATGLRVHYLQSCFVPNDTFKKLPNIGLKGVKNNDIHEENREIITDEEVNDFLNSVNDMIKKMNSEKHKFNSSDFDFINTLKKYLETNDKEILKKNEDKILKKIQDINEKFLSVQENKEKKITIEDLDIERKKYYNLIMKKVIKTDERKRITNKLISYKNNITNENINEFNQFLKEVKEYYENHS